MASGVLIAPSSYMPEGGLQPDAANAGCFPLLWNSKEAPRGASAKVAADETADETVDELQAAEQQRFRRHVASAIFFGCYVLFGLCLYFMMEGWPPSTTLLFVLSMMTGVGYGHVVPSHAVSKVVTAVYVCVGLTLFAIGCTQVLDAVVYVEIKRLAGMIEKDQSVSNSKRTHFIVGAINVLTVIFVTALILYLKLGEDIFDAIYLAAIVAFQMDSLCVVKGVECSSGWQASNGGKFSDRLLALCWYFLTYGTVGHFLISAGRFLGMDPFAHVGILNKFERSDLNKMDVDCDGKVSRSEFLRERLIEECLCEAADIDLILRNFDRLDKDHNDYLNSEDLAEDIPGDRQRRESGSSAGGSINLRAAERRALP